MLATDEEAFICDMAETYQIYDYRRVPCRTLGILAAGLREDSRIKMKISGVLAGTDTRLLANIMDIVNLILWTQTKDAEKGRNRPELVSPKLYAKKEVDHSHDLSISEYKTIRDNILKGNHNA